VFINTVGAYAKMQTLVTLQMQLCIAASAKPSTALTAALAFTNKSLLVATKNGRIWDEPPCR
jgi:hypothetical protein